MGNLFRNGSVSWKTSLAGIAAIITLVSAAISAQFDEDPTTVPDWNTAIAAVFIGFGLVTARDGDKSSEQTGAKG